MDPPERRPNGELTNLLFCVALVLLLTLAPTARGQTVAPPNPQYLSRLTPRKDLLDAIVFYVQRTDVRLPTENYRTPVRVSSPAPCRIVLSLMHPYGIVGAPPRNLPVQGAFNLNRSGTDSPTLTRIGKTLRLSYIEGLREEAEDLEFATEDTAILIYRLWMALRRSCTVQPKMTALLDTVAGQNRTGLTAEAIHAHHANKWGATILEKTAEGYRYRMSNGNAEVALSQCRRDGRCDKVHLALMTVGGDESMLIPLATRALESGSIAYVNWVDGIRFSGDYGLTDETDVTALDRQFDVLLEGYLLTTDPQYP